MLTEASSKRDIINSEDVYITC